MKLKKMISVVLSVIICCLCLIVPANAVGSSPSSTTMSERNFGLKQVHIAPAVYDENLGAITKQYAFQDSTYYPNGNLLVNMKISLHTQSIYENNNCNAWVIKLDYIPDSDIRYVQLKSGSNLIDTNYGPYFDTFSYYIIDDLEPPTYTKYNLVATYTDGSTSVSGGNIRRATA